MAETTPGARRRGAGGGHRIVEKLSQLHAVFDYYDTDRDGASTGGRCQDG